MRKYIPFKVTISGIIVTSKGIFEITVRFYHKMSGLYYIKELL